MSIQQSRRYLAWRSGMAKISTSGGKTHSIAENSKRAVKHIMA